MQQVCRIGVAMESKNEFYIDPGLWKTTLVAAFIIGGMSVYAALLNGQYQYLLFAAILFALSFWQRNRLIITFFDDHFEMKASMLGSRQFIYIDQIVSVERKSLKRAKVFFEQAGHRKYIKLPLGILSPVDRDTLVGKIEKLSCKN